MKSPLGATLIHATPRWMTSAAVLVYLILFMSIYAIQNLHLLDYVGYLGSPSPE